MPKRQSEISSPTPVHRISGPAELLEAVPYLLGFHPHRSVVLVGLRAQRLVVTGRLDLVDAIRPEVMEHTLKNFVRGGAGSVVVVVYDEPATPRTAADYLGMPWVEYAEVVAEAAEAAGCEFADALLVSGRRWWSLTCEHPECCPAEGRELGVASSAFAAQAIYEGMVARPDRRSLEALLEPLPIAQRELLEPLIVAEERAGVQAVLRGTAETRTRKLKRELFAAARASDSAPPTPTQLTDEQVVRYVVALSVDELRLAVWLAVDARRIDGRPLWLELARRAPNPYDARALLLFGWAAWREGNCSLAGIAAERAIQSDSTDPAADMLLAAATSGVSPHTVPKLRRPA